MIDVPSAVLPPISERIAKMEDDRVIPLCAPKVVISMLVFVKVSSLLRFEGRG